MKIYRVKLQSAGQVFEIEKLSADSQAALHTAIHDLKEVFPLARWYRPLVLDIERVWEPEEALAPETFQPSRAEGFF